MKHVSNNKASSFMIKASNFLEIVVGIILILGILISLFPIVSELTGLYVRGGGTLGFQDILEELFTVIIGVEFLKMLCSHDIDSVVEVLLFTIARKMIVGHGTALDDFLLIVGIGILFAVRKYLFINKLDGNKCCEKVKEEVKVEEEVK